MFLFFSNALVRSAPFACNMYERQGRRNDFGRYTRSRLEVKVRDYHNGLSRSVAYRFANISVAPIQLLQVQGFESVGVTK